MERVMSVEERIRRAEDIYNKRNNRQYSKPVERKNKKNTVKKMFMQIFICLSIYIVFYAVMNREYVFSEEFRNEVSVFFTEKTKIAEWYSNAKAFIAEKIFNSNKTDENELSIDDINEQNENSNEDEKESSDESTAENIMTTEETTEQTTEETSQVYNDENIGGAETEKSTETTEDSEKNEKEVSNTTEIITEELSEQQQMEKDAEDIKSRISFILPINGTISSTFGWRNPTTSTVPKYHTGLDIAAKEGTVIKSATDGTIILVSSEGDYGNHYQIQTDDIIIVYAHCKKLYLKNGEKVKQGQEIAEVGSTGNSTGPHLHFEIRKGEEKIDPQLILDI